MRRLELGLTLALAGLVAALLLYRPGPGAPPSPWCRGGPPLAGVYHVDRLRVRRRCDVAAGVVTSVKFEAFDGDVHVDLRENGGGKLVVEIIPQDRSSVAVPVTGTRVTVVGPRVDDLAHGWPEIHPAWWISSGSIIPATPRELARVNALLRDTQ